ncbi:hypothetical protein AVEN_149002-1 [Araneus ventricosus]|uniref:Uncharacterized protein n=1 Tax=Araneus ventricosus TaxID=182803 RepID=A0A4Y2VJ14_ARAVE|nr:hypothetical protein AVEN_149002-1 [Araneus ventricosus]
MPCPFFNQTPTLSVATYITRVLNRIVDELNALYEEINNRNPAAQRITKALYMRITGQFLGEEAHSLTTSNTAELRRILANAQRLARSKRRRTVIDTDIPLSLPET